MQVKLFEVRDRATFIPCWGILITPTVHYALGLRVENKEEAFLIKRAGFLSTMAELAANHARPSVMFGRLDEGGETQYDPHAWSGRARTLPVAHRYIFENWDDLESGDVVDVEFILGETPVAKESEAYTIPQ